MIFKLNGTNYRRNPLTMRATAYVPTAPTGWMMNGDNINLKK